MSNVKSNVSHHDHDIYTKNVGSCYLQEPMPLPPTEGFSMEIKNYKDVPEEPRFDPNVHLQLEYPEYVRLLPNFEKAKETPSILDSEDNRSRFAYSAPFQVFSEEGMKVLSSIIKREEKNGTYSSRGSKIALRGLYYMSPWVRDLQQCQQLLDHFRGIAGEALVPHPSFSNSPQINLSIDGNKGPVDIWHYDSIAYTGVVLLNDVHSMKGGELEIMSHDKHLALKLLDANEPYQSKVISYEKAGKMILAQGSEILHHVTPVTNNAKRISLIFGFGPANCFQPPKTNLRTMERVDVKYKIAGYEFFREKAWQTMHCLRHYAENMPFRENRFLGEKLRSIATELQRASDILEGNIDDTIDVFNEQSCKLEKDTDEDTKLKK